MRDTCVTEAIVLRSWAFGESDKIVSFFTHDYGKVSGIAKGAKRSRKRFVNTLEPFSLVKLYFQDRSHTSLVFVHACDLIRPFKDLTVSLEKIAYAFYLIEITDELTREREENRPLFEHLKEGLAFVEERGTSLSFLALFEMKLLKMAGYQPMLEHCRRCKKGWEPSSQTEWRFSLRDGGILCAHCSLFRKETLPLSQQAVGAMVGLQEEELFLSHSSFPLSVLKESCSVLTRFIQFQINKELKSASFVFA